MIKKKSINLIILNHYMIVDEIMFNFDQIFTEFDREFKAKIEFLNLKFAIKILNFKKKNSAFYARFVGLIVFFEFTNN